MGLVSQDEIIALRKSVDIVQVISKYVPLEQKGKNYFGVCPFHSDHSPSMSVSQEKQIYKCFSCGAAGNVFTFIQNFEDVSFIEALNLVAQIAGVEFSGVQNTQKKDYYEKYHQIMNMTTYFYVNNLKSDYGKKARSYLKKRHLNQQIIEEFQIGLALDKRNALYQVLNSKNYKDEELETLGLINKDSLNDYFINRIMFPLCDSSGFVVGFSGRIYDEQNSNAKYLNTKETIIFKKGQILFNYAKAKSYVKLEKKIILVEGYMDAIRLYSCGIKNVVALMGTSLTKEQIQLLFKLRCKIILCLDNDTPGQKATFEIGRTLKAEGFNVEVVELSNAKDPDEYVITYGIAKFSDRLNNTLKFLDFTLKYLKLNRNLNNSIELSEYINDVLNILAQETDQLLIDINLKKIAEEYKVSYDLLNDKINKLTIKEDVSILKPIKNNEIKHSKHEKLLQHLLYYMMSSDEFIKLYQEHPVCLNNVKYQEILQEILNFYQSNGNISIADFLSYMIDKEGVYNEVLDIVNKCSDQITNQVAFNDYLNGIKKDNQKQNIKVLKDKLKNTTDSDEKIKIADMIAKIKKGCV